MVLQCPNEQGDRYVGMLGSDVFKHCSKLKTIFYRGTEADWAQIEVQASNTNDMLLNPKFKGITVFYYSEEEPTEEGNFWHYVDGKPTPWETNE